jgi:lipoprotein-anchoring transpeptidase ErfK/SrfK
VAVARAGGLAAAMLLWAAVPGGVALAQAEIVVQPGDTLGAIAKRYGTTTAELVRANGLASADLILAGQRIALPAAAGAAGAAGAEGPNRTASAIGPTLAVPAASSTQLSAAPGPGGATVHVVQRGESLWRIAARYGSTVPTLVAANHLTSADVIHAGQRLVIPTGGGMAQGRSGGVASGVGGPAAGGGRGRYVVVALARQELTAYEDGREVRRFPISSGRAWTPTPVGRFQVYLRYRHQNMSGPGYYLAGVPHVQYFVGNYALHGAYWHNLFGTPTSHGCVNLRLADAAWLWDWAAMGTEVIVEP